MSIGVKRAALVCLFTAALAARAPAQELPLSHQVVGDKFQYTIERGDNFIKLGSRFGVGSAVIAAENGLTLDSRLTAGKTLEIDNRHVVPSGMDNGIVINVPQRMLFYLEDGKAVGAYAAAVGRVAPQWRTTVGSFKIIQLRKDPTWRVPASILREAEIDGKDIEDIVPPGPDNPLGGYWMGLSFGSLGIHSTNSPLGIYGFHTHGCIRLGPRNAEALYESIDIGDRGEIIYRPTLLASLEDGHIFLEVNRDAYKRGTGGIDYARRVAEAHHLSDLIDWPKAQGVADRAEGIARDVTAGGSGEERR
jgi:L,D-transpeptidase ErfK/SrfK